MIVYACLIYDCSEAWIESLHSTKRGAYITGRAYMMTQVEQGYESRACIGKTDYDLIPFYHFKVIPMEIKMDHFDSTGKPVAVGDRVRYRGEEYTIKTFLESKGCCNTPQIEFEEEQHVTEIADEFSIDRIS